MNIQTFKNLLLSMICLISISTWGQERGKLSGKVLLSDTSAAENITVVLKGTSYASVTNQQGQYEIRNIKPGTYVIRVSAIGIKAMEENITITAGEAITKDFSLSETKEQLNEVVIETNRYKYKVDRTSSSLRLTTPILEVPQNIQVVTARTLSDQQVISMSDGLIRNVSGAVRLEHWGDLYTNITMRGSQIQAFRNGFNVVTSFWGPLTEDVSFVDHIEFVKGPAGFMLANGDPSGLYNVVTKKPTGETKGEVNFTLGSFDLYRASLDLDGKLSKDGKLLYRLNIAGQNKGSHRPYEFNDRYSIAPVISYQLDDRTKVTAEYTLQHAKMSEVGSYYVFGVNGYATLPVDFTMTNPGIDPTKIMDQSISLNLRHQLNDNWSFTAQAAYYDYDQVGTSTWPSKINEDGTIIRNVGIWDAKSKMSLGQAFLNGEVKTGSINHRILAGLDLGTKEYIADWAQSHDLDTEENPFDPNNPDYSTPINGYPNFDRDTPLSQRAIVAGGLMDQRYTGIYLQDELGFFENKLRLTLAGRYTTVTQSSWGGPGESAERFSPRVGLSYSINDETAVYGLYDQAFTPQSGKLANGGSVKPITGNNIEFGIKKDWFAKKWNTTLSLYRILKENELTPDPLDPTSGESIVFGQKRAQGIEFDLRGEILGGLNVTANYAFTESIVSDVAGGVMDIKEGDVVPGYAKHTANAWLGYTIPSGKLKGFGINGGFTFLDGRATDTWSDNGVRLPTYFKLDTGLTYEGEKVRITANVFNVLNRYLYSGSYEAGMVDEDTGAYYWQTEAPRNLRLSIAYKF